MRPWRTLLLVVVVAVVGGAATLLVGLVLGMGGGELIRPASLSRACGRRHRRRRSRERALARRASLRQRFVAVAVLAAAVAIANLAALAMQMFVSDHDATLVTVLLLYAVGAGVAAALVVARQAGAAIRTVEATARRLGEGDLDARASGVDAGPELETLATALDEMADRLRRAQDRERDAEHMRRDLITTISHDLRTPLASLRAMVEAIDEGVIAGPSEPPPIREPDASIGPTAGNDGRRPLRAHAARRRRHRGGDAAGSARRGRLHSPRSRGAVRPGEGLGARPHLGTAGDAPCSPRVARVLQNLLANAVRHTPADGTIRIEAGRADGRLQIAVEDSGEGIAPDDLPRVFDPFFRADPARSGPGAGLGLALAKRIVEALGGRISAERGMSTGARFDVELPV